jgi:hypothetical protein
MLSDSYLEFRHTSLDKHIFLNQTHKLSGALPCTPYSRTGFTNQARQATCFLARRKQQNMRTKAKNGMIRQKQPQVFAVPLYQCRNTNGRLQYRKLRVIVQMHERRINKPPFIQKVLL